ncbi:glycine-rich domain-containing protein [Nocardia sp. NPDC051052]|uniref:glycine-rich domain-containing protein n=1 Tax=Nocardia sp. NPDC051052 TaxID=3364322 RepID=UPI0037A2F868
MTSPNPQIKPDGAWTSGGPNSISGARKWNEQNAKAAMSGGVGTSLTKAQAALHTTYNDRIDDHSQSIGELKAAYNQLILQGHAIVFTGNSTYQPPDALVSLDVILIGAGGGGSSGSMDLAIGARSGGGGGGGGELHTNVPASLLPMANGHFLPIPITIGAPGKGGPQDRAVGTGGGDTSFGNFLTAGGGNGGSWGNPPEGWSGIGGAGMIPGGNGGRGGHVANTVMYPPTNATNSTSEYALYGGGGGGGAGASGQGPGTSGGIGGASPGGSPANPGQPGKPPGQIVATGGGGGGGGIGGANGGGDGAFPAGGGGGSACSTGGASFGGRGGAGILYVIERFI